MNTSLVYIAAIILGTLALIIGILYMTNMLGNHPIRAIVGLGIGVLLLISGIVGWIGARPKKTA